MNGGRGKWMAGVFCLAGAFAGWALAPEMEEPKKTDGSGEVVRLAAERSNAPGARLAVPPTGSAALARLPAELRAMSPAAAAKLVQSWPGGTARMVALALLPGGGGEESGDGDEAKRDWIEKITRAIPGIARELAAGKYDWGFENRTALQRWIWEDPAAAGAAILQMPDNLDRWVAIGEAVQAMSESDPAGALQFALRSGGKTFGEGVGSAWSRWAATDGAAATEFLTELAPERQRGVIAGLAEFLRKGGCDDRDSGAPDVPAYARIWDAVKALPEGPEVAAIMEVTGRRAPDALLGANHEMKTMVPDLSNIRGEEVWLDRWLEQRAAEHPEFFLREIAHRHDTSLFLEFDANRSAARVIPQLCRTGHVAEAVQLLEHVQDAAARRAALEAVLPFWMDADPVKARAAFEAAPLTALERERWRRHPAFVLNP